MDFNIRINEREGVVNWEKLTAEDINIIEDKVIKSIYKYSNSDAFLCTKIGCHDRIHFKQLDDFYSELGKSVMNGASCFKKEVKKMNKYKVIPGWNRKVKQLHANARSAYLSWLNKGRNRMGNEFENMKATRNLFKTALNDCKVNEFREKSISIQENLQIKIWHRFRKRFKTEIIRLRNQR